MSQKLNLNLNIQAYSDQSASTNSSLTNFRWNRSFMGSDCSNAKSESFQLNPLETKTLHNGLVTLTADNTTSFDLSLSQSGQYVLSYNSGTLPGFRTKRAIGSDATTSFIVSRNANVMTFTYSTGTIPSFASVTIGDVLKLDTPFNVANRGYYNVIAKSSTSVSIINYSGAEEVVVLGSSFNQNFKIFSSGPLSAGQTFKIENGFSLVTIGIYVAEIVEDDRIFFTSVDLPLETNILASVSAYSSCKSFIYIECNENAIVSVNGQNISLKPILVGCDLKPGIFMLNSDIYSLSVSNAGIVNNEVFYCSVEA